MCDVTCTGVVQVMELDDKSCCWRAIVSAPRVIGKCALERIFVMEWRELSACVLRCDPHSTER